MTERTPNQVAIVTGAASGIGTAIAERLSIDGYRVVLADIDKSQLARTVLEMEGRGSKVLASPVDITQKDQVGDMIEMTMARFGTVDVLVNNAGIIRDGFLTNLSEEDWDRVLDVNLKGAFLCCQAVFPVMKEKQAGRIVNISSRAWLGNIGQANYSASKGGLVSLTRTLALEFARYQINVNAIAPGLIDTPMTRGLPEKSLRRLLQMQPTGKMGSVKDIAAAVSFLVSDDARFITGQILHVDGGKSCGLLAL
ncbi:MAG: 3-oxoacyl-ACP reductase FabG [Chloracidobacterium sp.]|nr:3-oxoacyl-ACP reductase FabG [Chloracidobacterium sp.]